jgi:predicted phosphodiesterase
MLDKTLDKLKTSELLEEISKRGFISQKREVNIDRTYKWPAKKKPFKIGVVSDCHLTSQYQQISLLHETYDIFADQGITDVLHCGDLLEGSGKMHRDQLYEMFIVGGDKCIDYAVKNYPKKEGMTTHIISGNHCFSIFNDSGIDPIAKFAENRKDIDYLGAYSANIEIGKIKIQLMHPDNGVPYARSYRQQKIIEQMVSDKKPHILLIGHYHVNNILPQYRNVYSILLPCFQSQTPYLRRKGLNPDIGAVILEITPDAKGVFSIKVENLMYKNPVGGDY